MPQYLGLINQGSTCYLNSLLQTLFMTPQFRQNVYSYVAPSHDERKITATDSIPYQLQRLFVLLEMKEGMVKTKGLLKSFQWDQVDAFQQHDVQEFCRVLFEALEKSSKGSNWIEKMYSGVMESFISCGKHPRANQQIFMDISLPIKNPFTGVHYRSIQECLYQYLRPESIDDKIDCEGCGEKVKVEKGMRLVNLPPILTLQVNRFQLNFDNMQREKINSFLYFPEILELWRFMRPFQEIKIKDMPKDLIQKTKFIEKEKSARTTDWGFDGGLGIQGKKIQKPQRKKSFEIEAEKKQTKFYDEQNRDKRQDQTKKLSAEQQKMKNIQILKQLKAEKQKSDKKATQKQKEKSKQQKKESKPAEQTGSSLDDDMLFGTFMQGFDRSGKLSIQNQFSDIVVGNSTAKGPKFQKTQPVFQHEQQQYDINKEYPKNTYILFSILVHSGGAYGGHYYAYIFNGIDWYCFNDNNVRKATKQEIRKYGHPSESISYGANAYLLFYREASTFKDVINSPIKIPQELIEKVKNDKTTAAAQAAKADTKQFSATKQRLNQIHNSVVLKIKHNNNLESLIISSRNQETIKSLKKILKTNLNITEQDHNWRFRRYNRTQDTLHEIYDIEENMEKTLDEIGLRETCYVAIETKKEEEQFMDYDPKNIIIKLNVWRNDLTLLTETYLKPVKLGVREEHTFKEFYNKVEKVLHLKNPIILKRNFSVGNPYQIFDLEKNADRTLISLRFFNGINLYVEQNTTGKLKWQKQFEDQRYKCQIKFNNPKEGTEKNHQLFIDTRKTLGQLKQKLSQIIGIGVEDFRVKKSQQAVSQMTSFKKRLVDLKFVNAEYLYIEQGKSSKGTIIIRKGMLAVIDDQIEFSLGEEYQTEIQSSTMTVADLKAKIAVRYGIVEFNVRVREFKAHQFGEIFRDSENLLKIREKSLVWQQLQIQDAKGIQIYLRVFDVMTLQLGPILSIFVQNSGNYEQLAMIIQQQTQIKSDKILIHKPVSNFVDKSLLFECDWHETSFLQRPIREQPLFICCDGDILIVKEAETAYQAKPVQRYQVYGGDSSVGGSKGGKNKETGLKITVIEEKQHQQDAPTIVQENKAVQTTVEGQKKTEEQQNGTKQQ